MLRFGAIVALLVLLLPLGKAAAFLGVQVGVFGVLLGGSFIPNHTGMPIVPRGARIDFLHRQVLMSRTVRDLVVGSNLTLVEAGTHPLKGVDGEWQVYELAGPDARA